MDADVSIERGLEPLAQEWSELEERLGAIPFARHDWLCAWWRAFGAGVLEVVVARRHGRLVGVLPLWRRSQILPGLRTLRSLTNPETPEYAPLAEDREVAAALADVAFRRPSRRVVLEYLDAGSPHLEPLEAAARARGYAPHTRTLLRPPYVDIDGGWDAFLQTLDSKFVRDLRRRRRRLDELGVVTVDVSQGETRMRELLEEGFALEPSGWKGETAIVARPAVRAFYSEVATAAARRGSLRIAFLRIGPRAIAFQLGLEDGRVHYFLKGGYDPSFARFAPGRLLAHAMLERAFVRRLRRFEFLGADEDWKLSWTAKTHDRVVFSAVAPTLAGRAERRSSGRW